MATNPTRSPSHSRRAVWCALAVVALAVAVRAPRLNQSLWLDEMTTLDSYVRQPWHKVLAGGAGDYVPNNHVLHTVLAKLAYPASPPGRYAAPAEAALRLPALVAGCLLPVALAWPLRRRSPLAAVTVALLAAVHPWLVAMGSEARGYTLMLLLGVMATNLLPSARATPRRVVGYAAMAAASVYTVPLAVLLLPAHGLAVALTDRAALRRWLAGATIAAGLSVGLYLPMWRGLAAYYAHPYPATNDYRGFLDALPRMTLAGDRLPARPDPALYPETADRPDPPSGVIFWVLPVLAIAAGTAAGWARFPAARPLLASLGCVGVLGALLPMALPSATEVRFDTWTAPWFCLSVGLLLAAIADVRTPAGSTVFGRPVAVAALLVLLSQLGLWDAELGPNQRVRETMRWVDDHAPPGRPVVVAFIGANEVADCYGGDAPQHVVAPVFDHDRFALATTAFRRQDGRLPWVVVPFEGLMRQRETDGFWRDLTADYRLVARFPGRFGAVSVFAPKDDAAATRR
jgi:hypothetical protein